MHMTTAMTLNMSLAMQGPTQCGKFETVNALAKLLGRLFIVFSCNQTTQITTFTAALQGWFSFFY
jgi:MoxR-like ATPase